MLCCFVYIYVLQELNQNKLMGAVSVFTQETIFTNDVLSEENQKKIRKIEENHKLT